MPPDERYSNAEECTPSEDPNLKGQDGQAPLDQTVMREAMLNSFPLSEEELDRALLCCDSFTPNATFYSLVQGHVDDNEHLHMLQTAEEHFLPESSLLLQQAYKDAFVCGTGHDDSETFRCLEAAVSLIGRRGARCLLQIIFRAVAKEDGQAEPEALASLVYRLLTASEFLKLCHPQQVRPTPQAWVTSLKERSQSSGNVITEAVWMDWVNSVAPQVYQTLSTFAHMAIFTPDHPFRSTSAPLSLPQTDKESGLWRYGFQTVPSSIALLSPRLGGHWIRQYSSETDGCSFAMFEQALLAYQGTSVILIQTTSGDTFGYFSDTPWKQSKNWFGQEADSFLFGIKPSLQYYAPVGGKPYSMYLNNPVTKHPGDLYGLCVGGVAPKSPRLHITPTFENCKAQSLDGNYDMGPLLSNHEVYFDIDVIEVWAVNMSQEEYEKALSVGKAQFEVREGARIRAAQVDRKQFLEDFQSGQFENKLFEHREQTRGRHSFCAGDEEGEGYYIDEKRPADNLSVRLGKTDTALPPNNSQPTKSEHSFGLGVSIPDLRMSSSGE